jgi:hypothetical protein
MKRYWIFSHFINNIPVYERSTPYEYRALERVKELKEFYENPFYLDFLPNKFFS